MSDENDIYLDDRSFGDLSVVWEHACKLFFANGDLYRRTVGTAHPVVRKKALEWVDDEATEITYFLAPTDNVRRRLHLQGYTEERCRALWEREYLKHIAKLEEMNGHIGIDISQDIDCQKGLSFEQWLERENDISVEHRMLKGIVEFDMGDIFASMALQLKYFKPEYVWTDLASYADRFDLESSVHQNLQRLHTFDYSDYDFIRQTGTVLILTEGRSDTRILSTAINAMYPEFSDMFQFLDFEEFSIDGGASMLTKMVKTLAGVRLDQPIIALFDNDAAGLAEHVFVSNMRELPDNIKSMTLPDIELAKNYPTIGPEGERKMDVNGTASSIELFLGKEALTDQDGKLHAVRWTAWNKQISRYQGALENKEKITQRFLCKMKEARDPISLRNKYVELDKLLNAIFCVFH